MRFSNIWLEENKGIQTVNLQLYLLYVEKADSSEFFNFCIAAC
jgi:hypothetical protein